MSELSGAEGRPLATSLAEEAAFTSDYTILVVASCLLATLGLLANSPAVVIGAMVVAPLMRPIRALAWGALQHDLATLRAGLAAVVVAAGLAVALSAGLGILVGLRTLGPEVLARTQPNLLDLGVAIVAGAVAAYAKLRPQIGDAIGGTAIAVALMPPLCAAGLGAADANPAVALGALLLFLTNLLGIALAAMTVFAYHGQGAQPARAQGAITVTALLTAVVAFPLGYSFLTLLQQARLAAALEHVLTNRTVTVGQNMELVSTRVDWRRPEPEVRLLVRARQVPSARQVELVERFVQEQTHTPFHLVFEVSLLEEVRAGLPPAPSASPASAPPGPP